jgi:hypothetical protein
MDGYDRVAHLYDIFDRKDNLGFFTEYGLRAGQVIGVGAGPGEVLLVVEAVRRSG